MTTLREAAQQALEALEMCRLNGSQYLYGNERDLVFSSITALKAALAEPTGKEGLQVEPVQEPKCNGMPAIEGPLSRSQRMREAGFTRRPRGWVKDGDEPVQEPVAWAGHDLDAMADAFSQVIEAHHSSRHPFHNPLDMDARMALRILRGVIPAMKAYTAPPQRKPLSEEQIKRLDAGTMFHESPDWSVRFARAVERAHGIGGSDELA